MDLRLASLVLLALTISCMPATADDLERFSNDPFAGLEATHALSTVDTAVDSRPSPRADRIGTTVGDETISLIACNECGHPANACACVDPIGETYHEPAGTPVGELPIGQSIANAETAAGVTSDCRFTNLYWCNPYGEVYLDPCDRGPGSDCDQSDAPLLYVSAELLPLVRDQQDDVAFQTLGQAGEVALETGDFETELDAGAKVTLGAVLTDLFRLEATYLGDYEWSDRAAVRNFDDNEFGAAGDLFAPFSNFGTPVGQLGTDYNNFASIDMATQFDSIELNLRRRLIIPVSIDNALHRGNVANSLLVGVRKISLDEQFRYASSSVLPAGGTVNRANITTDNDLFGVQVGLLSQFLIRNGQGWVDFEVKGGVFENDVALTSAFASTDQAGNSIGQFTGTDQRDRTAFLGELSLVYNRQVTRSFSYRLGYNAFWLSGVALASENLNTDINLLALGPAEVDHDSNLVLHGPTLGLTWAY